jgi:hypothetical protein
MDLSSIEQIIRTQVPNAQDSEVELYLDSVKRDMKFGADYSDMSEDDIVEDFEFFFQSKMDEVKKPSMKMTRRELKEMIKAAFIAESNDSELQNKYDFLAEADEEEETAEREETAEEILARITGTKLDPYSLAEAKDKEEEMDITVDAEEETTDGGEEKLANDSIVVDKKIVSLSSLPQQTRKILDSLETLRAQAEEFGDQKFITQVGNTITFFTRDFVVAGDEPTKAKVDESLEILKMKKLAGLLTEGEYAKALLNNINENTIPSVVDILKDPKLGLKHFAKLDAYDTKFKLKDDSEAVKKNPQLKGKEVEITGYYDPRENLLTIRSGNASVNVYPEEVEIIASTYTDNKEDYFKKNPKG